jgi:hypothetical protein
MLNSCALLCWCPASVCSLASPVVAKVLSRFSRVLLCAIVLVLSRLPRSRHASGVVRSSSPSLNCFIFPRAQNRGLAEEGGRLQKAREQIVALTERMEKQG